MSATSATRSTLRPGVRSSSRPGLSWVVAGAFLVISGAFGCAPIVRPADFGGARDQVTDASLRGPFDGVVLDADTEDPIPGATVVAVWAYDRGDGFIGPAGSEVVVETSDAAGRYRIPRAPGRIRGKTVRLVSFHLVVYERGYVGYRSETTLEGHPRKDFYGRQNEIRLRKWRTTDSHADHLAYLAAPRSIAKLAEWERDLANLDLYRAQGGVVPGDTKVATPTQEGGETATAPLVLDASGLLSPEAVRRRTGYTEAFEVQDLGDLSREPFYHGVHFQAVGHDETWDFAYRVWKGPPGGLDSVRETVEATLPGVDPTPTVTAQTWVYESPDVLAVAFLEPERDVGVLMTCGVSQCADIETVIILARALYENLDALKTAPKPQAPDVATPPAGAAAPDSTTDPTTGPGTDPPTETPPGDGQDAAPTAGDAPPAGAAPPAEPSRPDGDTGSEPAPPSTTEEAPPSGPTTDVTPSEPSSQPAPKEDEP